ncbi:RCC1 and BTB domain-containing protein 1-like [Linepithema humile]|uniref:RCC1 and BTB domain-containing protein 1-like n=1 Tax=Linepithema humile TaxID=83485 RepID=UPI00351DDB80
MLHARGNHVRNLATNLRDDIKNTMLENSEASMKSPKKSPKTPTESPNESPLNSTLKETLTNPTSSKEQDTILAERELECKLKNDRNLQHYNTKFWQLLSILDTDFLLQIETVLLYGWSKNFINYNAALIVTKDKNVYEVGTTLEHLGLNCINSTPQPEKVRALCQENIKTMISSCEPCLFVLTEEGKIYSWGNNETSKLGHNTTNIINEYGLIDTIIFSPLQVSGLADKHIVDIKCGYFHVLVLTDDRKVYGWGLNKLGQIDDTNADDNLAGMPIEVVIKDEKDKKKAIESISCGSTFSMAITCDGELYSWGENVYGQLGVGDNLIHWKPIKIMIDVAIAKVECGLNHTLALSREGLLYVWGRNDQGQLGTGNYHEAYHPILMDTKKIGKVTDIATQIDCKKSAAINTDKRIYVWGDYASYDILSPIVVNLDNIQDVFTTNINVSRKPCFVKVEKQKSNILKCWEAAFNNSTSADVEFVVDQQSLHIHRTFIMIRCPEMFKVVFANNTDKVITRNDFSAASYKAFLKYLYTDVIDVIDVSHEALELFSLAILYHEEILVKNCSRMIKEMTTISNVMYFYGAAISSKVKELEEFCFKYAINNLTAVVKTESYAELPEKLRFDFIIKAADARAFKH